MIGGVKIVMQKKPLSLISGFFKKKKLKCKCNSKFERFVS